MAYLIPVLIVCVVGIVAGVLLTVAAKIMFVPVDERVEQLTEALPGANCGGCGYAGCSDYASAIVESGADVNLCPVGGPSVTSALAAIMGVDAGSAEGEYAVVMCGGYDNKTDKIFDYQGIPTCKAVKSLYGGIGACGHGCLGYGDCVEACQFDAIGIVNGVAWVDRNNCVGCKACAKACPNDIIAMVPKHNLTYVACSSTDKGAVTRKVCQAGCIGCKKCEKVCKFDAIKVENNNAVIDPEKCKNCGMCAKECPTHAIVKLPKPAKAAAAK